jgi:hypothetical protein
MREPPRKTGEFRGGFNRQPPQGDLQRQGVFYFIGGLGMEKVREAIALLREANKELKKIGFRVSAEIKIVPFNGCIGTEDDPESDKKD